MTKNDLRVSLTCNSRTILFPCNIPSNSTFVYFLSNFTPAFFSFQYISFSSRAICACSSARTLCSICARTFRSAGPSGESILNCVTFICGLGEEKSSLPAVVGSAERYGHILWDKSPQLQFSVLDVLHHVLVVDSRPSTFSSPLFQPLSSQSRTLYHWPIEGETLIRDTWSSAFQTLFWLYTGGSLIPLGAFVWRTP